MVGVRIEMRGYECEVLEDPWMLRGRLRSGWLLLCRIGPGGKWLRRWLMMPMLREPTKGKRHPRKAVDWG